MKFDLNELTEQQKRNLKLGAVLIAVLLLAVIAVLLIKKAGSADDTDEIIAEISSLTPEELEELERAVLVRQARLLADEVLPAAPEGSALLTVGGCTLCDSCARPQGKPCRRPGAISYSLESLGCDVGAAIGGLWGWKLLWGERTRLPAYLTLVCAVLLP